MKPLAGFKNFHFVGIGGAGMSSLAEVLFRNGFQVSGSDLQVSPVTEYLSSLGIPLSIGSGEKSAKDWDCLVFSSAVPDTNISLQAAREKGIPAVKRAQLLGELMKKQFSLAIAGTHGKTTTTLMLASIFNQLEEKPTVIGGGNLQKSQSSAAVGDSEYLIVEADEYDRSFLKMYPTVALVNNIDGDHLECYDSMEHLENSFLEFIHKVPFYGFGSVCGDDKGIQKLLDKIKVPKITYGINSKNDLCAQKVSHGMGGSSYELNFYGKRMGDVRLKVSGDHNILNSLGAASVALKLNVPFSHVKYGLESFSGASRRMECLGEYKGVKIMDDYAHHPSEIKATLEALKHWKSGKVMAVFQPHLYSRTKRLYKEFAESLALADEIAVFPIYGAREENLENISSKLIVDVLRRNNRNLQVYESEQETLKKIEELRPGDLVVTLGAGDIWKFGHKLINEVEHA